MPDQFIEYFKNSVKVLPTINKKVMMIDVVDQEGDFQVVH